jgi:dephospho-CoA kinase
MLRVGLTGGLATGKTFVGESLAAMGCHLLQADVLGHQVLMPGGEAYDGVVREFGGGILEENGVINRRRLAAEVFDRPDRLAALNALVHPAVFAREEAWMARIAARDPRAIAIVEAAILVETGSYRRFDRLILTVCEERQQVERAMRRDGMTEAEAWSRLRRQMPLDEKRKHAHYVIDTSGSKEDTLRQVEEVYDSLRSMVQV